MDKTAYKLIKEVNLETDHLNSIGPRLQPYFRSSTFARLSEQLENPAPILISEWHSHLSKLLEAITFHLPASLVDWVAKNPTPGLPNGRFVHGTLLFADISGFTAMSESLSHIGREGAEEVTAIVNRYFTVMLNILRKYDGQLIRFGGDALLGLFEETTPRTQNRYLGIESYSSLLPKPPNSATRALMAAAQMQAAMSQFAQTETSLGTYSLKMSVGVHKGRFFAAQLGDTERMGYALFGRDVNETAAIESAASAGQVVVDQDTYNCVDPTLSCSAVALSQDSPYLIVECEQLPIINSSVKRTPHKLALPANKETVLDLVTLLDAFTPYLPTGVLARLVADTRKFELQGEHRLVATMFVNVCGLSHLVDQLGPGNEKETVRILNQYFGAISSVVAQFGGVINKIDLNNEGEKLLITFGAPVAHEDDPQRAVRAAVAMMNALSAVRSTMATAVGAGSLQLGQRIGITFGSVFAGFVGADWRHEYTVMGDQVNMAARLMSQAADGQIVVSESVKQHTNSLGVFLPQGQVKLKGKAKPVPIYELSSIHKHQKQWRGVQSLGSPMVGRQNETSILQEQVTSLEQGQGSIVSIIGEAGIGKSRLVREATAAHSALRLIDLPCLSFAETASYSTMQELVRRMCQISSDHDTQQAQTLFLKTMGQFWPRSEMHNQHPYLANFLGLPLSPNMKKKISYLDQEGLRQRTFIALRAFFAGFVAQQPTLIVLDDLQWIDGASSDLLAYLLPLSNGRPLLWLLLFRPEKQKRCWQLHQSLLEDRTLTYKTIQMEGLSAEESHEMLLHQGEKKTLPHRVTTYILGRAEGNPLYIEEVMRGLINNGILASKNDRWQLTQSITSVTVPDTLEGVLMARLDRLEPPSRWSAQVAAVIGRTFPYDVLSHTINLQPVNQIDPHLKDLQLEEMIQKTQHQPELVYSFAHSMLQEVAYQSQSVKARRQYHQRIAHYLENFRQQSWGGAESLIPLIAEHAYLGRDWGRALRFQMRTGEQAMNLYANNEAIDHYLKALESAEKLADEDTAVRRLNIHLALGQIYINMDQYDRALIHLDAAQSLADAKQDQGAFVAVCRWRTRLHELRGEYDEAFQWIERGLAVQVDTADVPQIMLLAGLIHIRQGEYDDALRYCHTVLELAQNQNEVTALARANNLLGITFLRGDSQKAIAHFQKAFALYEQASDVQGQATSHNLIANACFNLGRWSEADHHYRQALDMFDQLSDTYNRIMAVNNLGGIALNQGKLDEALAFYQEGVELARQIGGSAWMVGVFEMNLGAACIRKGLPNLALQHLREGESYFSQAGSRDFLPELMRHRAEALMLAENLAEAEQIIDRAFKLAAEQENQSEMGCSQRVQGKILLDQNAPQTAVSRLKQSVAILEALGESYEVAKSKFLLAKAIWRAQNECEPVEELLVECESIFSSLDAHLDLTAVAAFKQQIACE